jgi:hypothetical protein
LMTQYTSAFAHTVGMSSIQLNDLINHRAQMTNSVMSAQIEGGGWKSSGSNGFLSL